MSEYTFETGSHCTCEIGSYYTCETGNMTGILEQLKWESLKKRIEADSRLIMLYTKLISRNQVDFSY